MQDGSPVWLAVLGDAGWSIKYAMQDIRFRELLEALGP